MSLDQMKKMLMLVESCSCEQSQELDEALEYVAGKFYVMGPHYESGPFDSPEDAHEDLLDASNERFGGDHSEFFVTKWTGSDWTNNFHPETGKSRVGVWGTVDDPDSTDPLAQRQRMGRTGSPYEPFPGEKNLPASQRGWAAKHPISKTGPKGPLPEDEEQIDELGGNNYGGKIKKYFGKIGDHGDDGYEYLDKNAPVWAGLWEKYDGDIDVIINSESAEVLRQAAKELNGVVSDLESGMSESFDLDAFMESIREMVGGQLDEMDVDTLINYRQAASDAHTQTRNPDGKSVTYHGGRGKPNPREKGMSLALRKLTQTPDYKNEFDAERKRIADAGHEHKFPVQPHQVPVKVLATVKQKQPNDVNALGFRMREEVEPLQAQEDAELQSFMETLSYVMKR